MNYQQIEKLAGKSTVKGSTGERSEKYERNCETAAKKNAHCSHVGITERHIRGRPK